MPVYDNHTHLDRSPTATVADDALDYREHLDRASSVGVRGVVQVGTDLRDLALVGRDRRHRAADARRRRHPPQRGAPARRRQGRSTPPSPRSTSSPARPRVRAIGETGLDFFRTGRGGPRTPSSARSRRTSRSRRSTTSPCRSTTGTPTPRSSRPCGGSARPSAPCSTASPATPSWPGMCADNGWYMSFAGTVTFKNAQNLRDALDGRPAQPAS